MKLLLTSLLCVFVWVGCGAPQSTSDAGIDAGTSDSGTSSDAGPGDSGTVDAGAPPIQIPIRFSAKVGAESFICGKTFTGLGTTASSWTPKDFRFYVTNVRLVTADGGERPYTLKDDGVWQGENVGLLDFEDKSGQCSDGTVATHTQLEGEAAAGPYQALRFTLGIPFVLNHRDATVAQPPFNLSALFWGWQSGYRFLRIDGNTTGLPTGHNVHLGSTGCMNDPTAPTTVTGCTSPNRVEVTLENFNLDTQVVVADYAALVKDSNLDLNASMTAPGCMSGTDADCGPIFKRLGLPFGTQAVEPQQFFRVE